MISYRSLLLSTIVLNDNIISKALDSMQHGCYWTLFSFYPNAWTDQRIRQELKSVIAGWITSYPPCVRVDN